jgi:hypothetical protein
MGARAARVAERLQRVIPRRQPLILSVRWQPKCGHGEVVAIGLERAGRGSAFSGKRVEPQLPETSIGVPMAELAAFRTGAVLAVASLGRSFMRATVTGTDKGQDHVREIPGESSCENTDYVLLCIHAYTGAHGPSPALGRSGAGTTLV